MSLKIEQESSRIAYTRSPIAGTVTGCNPVAAATLVSAVAFPVVAIVAQAPSASPLQVSAAPV